MIQPNTLEHAEYLIGMAGTVDGGCYEFVAIQGLMALRKHRSTEAATYLLLKVMSNDINAGMTPKQWDKLDAAIRTARKEGILK